MTWAELDFYDLPLIRPSGFVWFRKQWVARLFQSTAEVRCDGQRATYWFPTKINGKEYRPSLRHDGKQTERPPAMLASEKSGQRSRNRSVIFAIPKVYFRHDNGASRL